MSQLQDEQLDRKDLKNQALLERVSNLTAQYENQSADLRVEYTLLEQEYRRVLNELEALKAEPEDVPVEEKPKKTSAK